MQMQNLKAASKQQKPAGTSTVASTASAFSSRVGGNAVGLASAIEVPPESQHSNGVVGRTPGQELVVLPISAVEAGLLPSNQGIYIFITGKVVNLFQTSTFLGTWQLSSLHILMLLLNFDYQQQHVIMSSTHLHVLRSSP